MAFPHPKSRQDNYRNGDKPNDRGVVWELFEGTVNVAGDRNREDEVNPANNRTLGGATDHSDPFPLRSWWNEDRTLLAVPASTFRGNWRSVTTFYNSGTSGCNFL